jgi:hypothetical protein
MTFFNCMCPFIYQFLIILIIRYYLFVQFINFLVVFIIIVLIRTLYLSYNIFHAQFIFLHVTLYPLYLINCILLRVNAFWLVPIFLKIKIFFTRSEMLTIHQMIVGSWRSWIKVPSYNQWYIFFPFWISLFCLVQTQSVVLKELRNFFQKPKSLSILYIIVLFIPIKMSINN